MRRFAPLLARLAAAANTARVPTAAKKRINIDIDGRLLSLDALWLRDACACARCVHPSTQQKLFQTTDLDDGVAAAHVERGADGALRVDWADGHASAYPPGFLAQYATARSRVRARFNDPPQVLWDGARMRADALTVDHAEYMGDDRALLGAVRQLARYGLVFVKNVPATEGAVAGLAERIGNLKNTFYGPTWDVKSIKNSKNIACVSPAAAARARAPD